MIRLQQVSLKGRLRDVTAEFGAGVTAVLGESGAGKSSLLQILAGYERPDSGRISRDASVFWAPSEPSLWPWMTVREHATDDVLELLELTRLADQKPSTLSLGEACRVNLARSLTSNADVLIWDEPLSHADGEQRARLWPRILELGRTIVFATHLPEQALEADAMAVCLADGALAWQGKAAQAYREPPSLETGWLFGPMNAAHANEEGQIVPAPQGRPVFFRPERTVLRIDEHGPWRLENSRFTGAFWIHRLSADDQSLDLRSDRKIEAQTSQRVGAFLTLLLLFCCLLSGCGDNGPPSPAERVGTRELTPVGSFLPAPRSVGVALRGGAILLDNAGRVLTCDENGKQTGSFFMPEYSVGRPEGVIQRADGSIVVCDTHYHRVLIFRPDGAEVRRWGRMGQGPGQFIYPVAVDQDAEGNLYIGEYGGNDRVQKFTSDGKYLLSLGAPGQFQRPSGIAVNGRRVYVADAIGARILIFHTDGAFEGVLGGDHPPTLNFPYDVETDAKGNLWIVEYGGGCLTCLSPRGGLIGRSGSTGDGPENLRMPWGLGLDKRTGRIFVADTGNRRLALYRMKP